MTDLTPCLTASPAYQLYRWLRDPYPFLDECRGKLGKVFTLQFPFLGPVVITSDDEMIRTIFRSQGMDLGDDNRILEPLVGKRSLLLLKSTEHESLRKQLLPSFQGRCLRGVAEEVRMLIEERVVQWKENLDVRHEMEVITQEVILTLVFGRDSKQLFPALSDAFRSLLHHVNSPLRSLVLFVPFLQRSLWGLGPGRALRDARKRLDSLLEEAIKRAGNTDGTLLKTLLDQTTIDGRKLTREEVLDQVRTLLLAGHETTATALTWAFYWLGRYPQWQEKVLEAQNLERFIDETLRIFPLAPIVFTRVATDTYQCGEYQFKKGTVIAPCVYLSHRDPETFPGADRFDPDRFKTDASPFSFYPFGGGNRRCLGAPLALMEMQEVITQTVSRYSISLLDSREASTRRRGVTLVPQPDVYVSLGVHPSESRDAAL